MDKALYERVYAAFMAAIELPAGELSAFLERVGAEHPAVRSEVEGLLGFLLVSERSGKRPDAEVWLG